MYVLITYKDEIYQMLNEGARVELYIRCLSAANSVVGGPVWQIVKLIQAFMGVHVSCKNEEDPLRNESATVVTKDFPL